MGNQSNSQGWRESAWNRNGLAVQRPVGRNRLALEESLPESRERTQVKAPAKSSTAAMQFFAAPWIAPVRHRYRSGNQWLIRMLEWMTAKTWPLAMVDDMCTWLEEGSGASRVFMGCAMAATMAALLTLHSTALYALQSMMLLPVFGGHGLPVLVAAAFVVGATILPTVLGHVLGVLLRFYVLINLCSMAALVGYGCWLVYSYR